MTYVRPEIEALAGYQPGEQPQTGKYIKLNTNENPYDCSPKVAQAIRSALDQGLSKYPDAVCDSFRTRAAEVLGVEPNWILCGNGSDDILTIVTRAFVDAGQTLRLPYPSYVLYKTLAQIQGARYEEVPFAEDWSLSAAFSAADASLRLVCLPNPNSPSGTVIQPSEILELARCLPCPLLVDEAYADFADQHCLDLVRQEERVMVSRSLSKSYALAGLRFGFLVAQPQIIDQLMKVKDSYNCDALSIAGATAAIDDQDWLHQTRSKILATRNRMRARLADLGFSVTPSQANFLWCTDAQTPLEPIYDELKLNRILVRYMNYAGWGEGLRISVGSDDQAEACLNLISDMRS